MARATPKARPTSPALLTLHQGLKGNPRQIAAEHPLPDGPWVFNRDELVSQAATKLVERVAQHKIGAAVPSLEQTDLEFSTT